MKNALSMAHCAKIGICLAFCFSAASYAQEKPAIPADAINWNDTFIGYRYAQDMYFPGSPEKVTMNIGSVTTTGGFAYGKYIFNFDYNVSDQNNPEANGTAGAQEVYSVGRVEWSANKVLGTPIGTGLIRDYGLTTGYEFSSKNDAYGSAARMVILGPTIDFAIPRGYWNLTAGVRTEDNHNALQYAAVHDIHFNPAWHVESSWLVPFRLASAPTVFKGFASITGPKGKDGFETETVTETLIQASWLFDLGPLTGHPRTVYVGPGYQYWKNMYGTPSSEAPGTNRSAAMFVAEVHF